MLPALVYNERLPYSCDYIANCLFSPNLGDLCMKRIKPIFFLFGILAVTFAGCASKHEYVMPFKSSGYTGESLFPVAENNSQFTFRAWVRNSTSIDRVFTVSYDKDFGYDGKLLEIQSNPVRKHKEDRTTFKQRNIIQKDGFEKFILKVDSLNLMDVNGQDENSMQIPLHQPFSLYVIEIKSHGKVHQFRFNTYFPAKEKVDKKYEMIQDLIFQEFDFKFYLKKG